MYCSDSHIHVLSFKSNTIPRTKLNLLQNKREIEREREREERGERAREREREREKERTTDRQTDRHVHVTHTHTCTHTYTMNIGTRKSQVQYEDRAFPLLFFLTSLTLLPHSLTLLSHSLPSHLVQEHLAARPHRRKMAVKTKAAEMDSTGSWRRDVGKC
jgi:hypothetical protein